jgi:endonuclease/exonuclease/phosphatase (EEP) superfamily protein YafD
VNQILTPVALALALATLCTLAARLCWLFDLFSHFRLQYVVAAALFALLALATEAWLTAGVLVAVTLVHGFALRNLWRHGPAADARGTPLRVLTFNVLAGNQAPAAVLRLVRASDADLVVIVDAKRMRWRRVIFDLSELYPYHVPRQRWPEPGWRWLEPPRIFLFSRFPIVGDAVAGGPDGPCLAVELAAGGQRLVLAGVHMAPMLPGARHRRLRRELEQFAEFVGRTDRPVLVAGDFNATPWSPHFGDLIETAGLRNAADGQGYLATWPSWFWPARIPIDHILLKGRLTVASLRRGPAAGSDHYQLIADLRLLPSR